MLTELTKEPAQMGTSTSLNWSGKEPLLAAPNNRVNATSVVGKVSKTKCSQASWQVAKLLGHALKQISYIIESPTFCDSGSLIKAALQIIFTVLCCNSVLAH